MKWVSALKLWNGDAREVSTKNVWGVPRKGTTDYNEVKDIMAGKAVPVKEAMHKRGERESPKEIVAKHMTKKTLTEKPSKRMSEADKYNADIDKFASLTTTQKQMLAFDIANMAISGNKNYSKLKPLPGELATMVKTIKKQMLED